jgi:hypothetical protein
MSPHVFISNEWYTFTNGTERFRYRIENASDTSMMAEQGGKSFFAVPDKHVQEELLVRKRQAELQKYRMITLHCIAMHHNDNDNDVNAGRYRC